MRAWFYVAVLVFTVGDTASAETVLSAADAQPGSRFYNYSFSQGFHPTLEYFAKDFDRRTGFRCESKYKIKTINLFINTNAPINFPENADHPTQGSWMIRYQADRCGQDSILSALFWAKPNGPMDKAPGIPGTTKGDLFLQLDTYKSASVIAAAYLKVADIKCGSLELLNTEPSGNVETAIVNGVKVPVKWNETWTFVRCGYEVLVPVYFEASPQGGTDFSIESKNVKLVKSKTHR